MIPGGAWSRASRRSSSEMQCEGRPAVEREFCGDRSQFVPQAPLGRRQDVEARREIGGHVILVPNSSPLPGMPTLSVFKATPLPNFGRSIETTLPGPIKSRSRVTQQVIESRRARTPCPPRALGAHAARAGTTL